MRRRHPVTFFVFLALLSGVFYFLPIAVPFKLCFVAAVLFLGSIGFLPLVLCLAFAFSCAGDVMGSLGNFPSQLVFFLTAHVFFSVFFIYKIIERGVGISLGKTIIGLVSLVLSLYLVIPYCPGGLLRFACICYLLCICVMLWSAMQQGSKFVALGAALFFISDFILAWNKFRSPLPLSRYLILVPYFSAQILLYIGVCRLKMNYIASRR